MTKAINAVPVRMPASGMAVVLLNALIAMDINPAIVHWIAP